MRFEPFTIDVQRWQLLRAGEVIDLSPRLVEILAYLAARSGAVVSKDELLERFWPDVYVIENTLTRAIADIRKALGDRPDQPQYIQTVSRRGYRFIAPIDQKSHAAHAEHSPHSPQHPAAAGEDRDPFRDWVRGRTLLESLDASELNDAIASFERAVTGAPDYAPAHVGLANAYFLQFEHSRVGNVVDRAALDRAITHARRGVTMDERLAEAWATLGFALAAAGEVEQSRAAARRAIAIEPTSWRHQYRLAAATWGEERLRSVDRTLALLPRFPAADFMSAMVHLARRALGPAREAARRGATMQAQQAGADGLLLPVAGLHWMCGLVEIAADNVAEATAAFDREIADARPTQIYGREFLINAMVSLGFLHLKCEERDPARQMFSAALESAPGHARSRVGLALIDREAQPEHCARVVTAACHELAGGGKSADAAIVAAAADAWQGRLDEACQRLAVLIDQAPPGSTGWHLAGDPMLAPLHGAAGFEPVLARVAGRAV